MSNQTFEQLEEIPKQKMKNFGIKSEFLIIEEQVKRLNTREE